MSGYLKDEIFDTPIGVQRQMASPRRNSPRVEEKVSQSGGAGSSMSIQQKPLQGGESSPGVTNDQQSPVRDVSVSPSQ